jgi:hypothetical protein
MLWSCGFVLPTLACWLKASDFFLDGNILELEFEEFFFSMRKVANNRDKGPVFKEPLPPGKSICNCVGRFHRQSPLFRTSIPALARRSRDRAANRGRGYRVEKHLVSPRFALPCNWTRGSGQSSRRCHRLSQAGNASIGFRWRAAPLANRLPSTEPERFQSTAFHARACSAARRI